MKTTAALALAALAASLALAQPARTPYLRADAAYVSPADFAAAFGGGVERVGGAWAWYYADRAFWFDTRLNKVSDARDGRGYDLPGPPRLREGRVVVPALAVSYVGRCVVQRTRPGDATVRVTCRGRIASLKRY